MRRFLNQIVHLFKGCTDFEIKFSRISNNQKKNKAAEFFHVAKAICRKCGTVDREAYLPDRELK